ncbi:hypothetical protein [Mucilaginibacter celer]|uniref:Uncharacterized protein n=1 Tax=Mucilaginibacter celer TaxID=2305508 RepID=A0A494VSM8_9SPHI|nr:hypothetical protein [Mucilaginibacter celer]AYL94363.1 hypothetical protein HYN43_003200 [Mucilaginibacter celer]
MLKSELHILDQQVSEIINNDKLAAGETSTDHLSGQVKTVQGTCSQLKKQWIQELYSPAKDDVISRYVQYHQSGITRLSDQLSEALAVHQNPAGPHPYDELFGALLTGLEDLLLFLQTGCYRFFDQDFRVTLFNSRRRCDEIAGLEKKLRLHPVAVNESALRTAIADSVADKLEEARYAGISYRDLDQTITILRIAERHIYAAEKPAAQNLQDTLYRGNLNTLHFFNWYRDNFFKKITGPVSKKEKERVVLAELERISGLFVAQRKVFEPDLPSIDQQVLPFLKSQMGHSSKAAVPGQSNGNSRLPLDLSVPQFAVFIRVLYKCGCFPVNNVAKIIRFFTGHFTTKKQSNISVKSFARAFYGLDQSAAAVVRDILQRMINYINKTYFH